MQGRFAIAGNLGDDAPVSRSPDSTEPTIRPDRHQPTARRIIARWRQLVASRGGSSSGEPTLIACSGGADSTALTIALASTGIPLTLFFAEHRARPRDLVESDRATVQKLAAALRAGFVSVACDPKVDVAPSEGQMRRSRYAAAAREARSRGLRFIATGHHADDQLETMLIALIRGAGPSGMAGMRETRPIDDHSPPVHLIRPMLAISRAESEQLCLDAGLHRPGAGDPAWVEDHTNSDTAYLRNRVRHEVVPVLEAIRPGLASRAALNAEWFRQLAALLDLQAESLDRTALVNQAEAARVWKRAALRDEQCVVLGQLLRNAAWALTAGEGLDRFGADKLTRIAEAIQDGFTEPRLFEIGDGFEVRVDAHEVELRATKNPA